MRFRADWAVVVAAWALLLCATTLLTAGTLYGDTVALGGIRAAIDDAPPADRSIVVRTTALASAVQGLDGPIRSELNRTIDRSGGEVVAMIRTDPFAPAAADPATVTTLIGVAAYEGIERHAVIGDGRWAVAGAEIHEATLALGAASALDVHVGDVLDLVGRLDSSLHVRIAIVGTWSPDPNDPYWLAKAQDIDGVSSSGTFTTAGPLMVPSADLAPGTFGSRLGLEWRAVPDSAGFRLDDLDAIRASANAVPGRLGVALPGIQIRVETRLGDILAAVTQSALVSRTGVLLLVLQFAVLAAYAIILVAGMLADRRRAETALMRSRGASSLHLALMTLFEAGLLAGLAVLAAPFLALGAVRWLGGNGPLASSGIGSDVTLSSDAIVVDVLTGVACVIALTIPMLGGLGSLAGVRAAISRQTGRTLAQRLGLDLALVVAAGIALWQLRLYGTPLARNARGILGVDPLLVAAPGIGLLAGAVVATRIIPRIAELAERILQRNRGLVGAMGGRGIARRPLRYTRSALLLMLAAALGTFATAHVATWTRSQGDQAAYQAGADLRMIPSQRAIADLTIAGSLRGIDGTESVMAVDRLTVDSGRAVRSGALLAVDAARAASIVASTPNLDGANRSALLAALAAARPAPIGVPLPDTARQLRILLTTQLQPAFYDPDVQPPDLTAFGGARVGFVIADGDGRLFRVSAAGSGFLSGNDQPMSIELPGAATRPIHLEAIDLSLVAPAGFVATGTVEVTAIEISGSDPRLATPGDWAKAGLQPDDPDWSWRVTYGSEPPAPVRTAAGAPWRINVGEGEPAIDPLFAGNLTVLRLAVATPTAPVPAIASRLFLEGTGSAVGDTVTATFGATRPIRIIGVADTFPTVDPTQPFLVVDGPTLVAANFATASAISSPTEWWIATSSADTVGASIRTKVDPAAVVISRASLEQNLLTDPVPLGVIGVLSLGSVAAMLFAAIGFVVAATISTRERLGEFALLRALGLSARELSGWLWLENAFLLVIGTGGGLLLGALLANVVLPVSTLTSNGAPAIPPPIVELPLSAMAPVLIVAGIVFALTILVLRRQLLQVRVGDVLRGRDE
ncbi:MAG: ABC transporter permease [Chloroflexota bacterium]